MKTFPLLTHQRSWSNSTLILRTVWIQAFYIKPFKTSKYHHKQSWITFRDLHKASGTLVKTQHPWNVPKGSSQVSSSIHIPKHMHKWAHTYTHSHMCIVYTNPFSTWIKSLLQVNSNHDGQLISQFAKQFTVKLWRYTFTKHLYSTSSGTPLRNSLHLTQNRMRSNVFSYWWNIGKERSRSKCIVQSVQSML